MWKCWAGDRCEPASVSSHRHCFISRSSPRPWRFSEAMNSQVGPWWSAWWSAEQVSIGHSRSPAWVAVATIQWRVPHYGSYFSTCELTRLEWKDCADWILKLAKSYSLPPQNEETSVQICRHDNILSLLFIHVMHLNENAGISSLWNTFWIRRFFVMKVLNE